jgi:hypothetical protein
MFIFQMKDRFRDDYRDIQHQHGEHRVNHTQEPQITSETLSATAAWLKGLLGEHCDDNSTQTAQANGSNGALAHLA